MIHPNNVTEVKQSPMQCLLSDGLLIFGNIDPMGLEDWLAVEVPHPDLQLLTGKPETMTRNSVTSSTRVIPQYEEWPSMVNNILSR